MTSILAEADNLTAADRQTTHGDFQDNARAAARICEALDLDASEPLDQPMILLALKLARWKQNRSERDNYVDAAGYVKLAWELQEARAAAMGRLEDAVKRPTITVPLRVTGLGEVRRQLRAVQAEADAFSKSMDETAATLKRESSSFATNNGDTPVAPYPMPEPPTPKTPSVGDRVILRSDLGKPAGAQVRGTVIEAAKFPARVLVQWGPQNRRWRYDFDLIVIPND